MDVGKILVNISKDLERRLKIYSSLLWPIKINKFQLIIVSIFKHWL